MKIKDLLSLMVVAFIFQSPAMAAIAGASYDAASDFSPTVNPHNTWSYGWSSSLGTPFNLDTENGFFVYQGTVYPGLDYWARNSVALPMVLHNGTSQTIAVTRSGQPDFNVSPGELMQHPGSDNSYALLRWTAPDKGVFKVASSFKGADVTGVTADVHVILNGISIFNGYVNGYGDSSKQTFFEALAVSAGDTIDFAVGPGGNGYSADSTVTSVSISAVPVPAAVYLFGSAAAGLGLLIKGFSSRAKA